MSTTGSGKSETASSGSVCESFEVDSNPLKETAIRGKVDVRYIKQRESCV